MPIHGWKALRIVCLLFAGMVAGWAPAPDANAAGKARRQPPSTYRDVAPATVAYELQGPMPVHLMPFLHPQGQPGDGGGDPPYEWLIPYYEDVTRGLIRPVADPIPPEMAPQDAFRLDVAGFNLSMGTADFAEAKRKFYGGLWFDWKAQEHERPYYYMRSWKLLFHPPVKRLDLPLTDYVSELAPFDPAQEESDYFQPWFQNRIDAVSGTELTYGNQLDLLPNGRSFQMRLDMVRRAKRSFFGMVMFFLCDESGKIFVDELAKKVKEGVDVRMVVEGLYGSTITASCVKRMKKAGIDVVRTADLYKPKYFLSVNHNKFWIRDGEEAVIGGQNFHDFENFSDGFNLTRDTDTHVKSGPIVTDLVLDYVRIWNRYKRKYHKKMDVYAREAERQVDRERRVGLRGDAHYARWLGDPSTRMNGICRVLVQDRGADSEPIAPTLYEYVRASKTRIAWTSPSLSFSLDYLKPGKKLHWEDRLALALRTKAEDGVPIDVISNGLAGGLGDATNFYERWLESAGMRDKKLLGLLVRALGRALTINGAKKEREHFLALQEVPTVRGWGYFQFSHSKIQYFDRIVTSIGSFNLDRPSSERNQEETLICMDRNLRDQYEAQYVTDLINSIPIVSRNGI